MQTRVPAGHVSWATGGREACRYRSGADGEHELAAGVALLEPSMRLGNLAERQHLGDLERVAAGAVALGEAVQPVPPRDDRGDPRLEPALQGGGEVRESEGSATILPPPAS